MTPADFQAARSRLTLLYGTTPEELAEAIQAAASRTMMLAADIRPNDFGAAQRALWFSEHVGALQRQALILSDRIKLRIAEETPDAA